MKNVTRWLAACLFVAACNAEDSLTPPEIGIDLSPVWIGARSIAEDAPAKRVDLQIFNLGEQTLEIKKVTVKGDQNCSFTWDGPDKMAVGANGSSFIRMWYKPTVRGDDSISLIIESNATNFEKFIVPVCGRGALQEEIDQMTDADGGVTEDDGPKCSAPPAAQPDCDNEGSTDSNG